MPELKHLNSKTSIPIKTFIDKVMTKATKETVNSIKTNFQGTPISTKYSYGNLEGAEIPEAVHRYPGKVDLGVAYKEIDRIALEQKILEGKQTQDALEARMSSMVKKQEKKQELIEMRERMKKEREKAEQNKVDEEEKKKKNIARSKASAIELDRKELQDLPIDY